VTAWLADVLIVLGLVVLTLSVYGVVRLPDVYTKLHASGKAAFLGVCALLLATALGGEPATVARVVLVVAALTLTTPVAAHVIAQAAYYRREPMLSPGACGDPGPAADTPSED
jgi:multicomponent Na+:H+ antiporter subunit G